jgi:hypothetical protein
MGIHRRHSTRQPRVRSAVILPPSQPRPKTLEPSSAQLTSPETPQYDHEFEALQMQAAGWTEPNYPSLTFLDPEEAKVPCPQAITTYPEAQEESPSGPSVTMVDSGVQT